MVTGSLVGKARREDRAACLLDDDRSATGGLAIITFCPIDCAKAPGRNFLGDLEVILQMDTVGADLHLIVSFGTKNMAVYSFSAAEVRISLRWSNAAAELLLIGCTVKALLKYCSSIGEVSKAGQAAGT